MASKLFHKIGEACKLLDIQPYVLRYWETEFPILSPDKSKSGQRVYSEQDLRTIRRIKELLYEEGYTIAGAKKKLEAELSSGRELAPVPEEVEEEEPPIKKKTAAKKTKGSASAAKPDEVAPEKQVVEMRKGIKAALKQAEDILGILEKHSKA